jgi:DnaJ-domain-containing protein 1
VLRGTVLQGKFEGRNLEELSFDDLVDLLHECRVNDPQSATVLETYLDRVHGGEWRGAGGNAEGGRASAGNSAMSRDEAYELLGLQPGASDAEIRDAHRKLLMANHPDKGGSTYIAAQINQARDVLLPGA